MWLDWPRLDAPGHAPYLVCDAFQIPGIRARTSLETHLPPPPRSPQHGGPQLGVWGRLPGYHSWFVSFWASLCLMFVTCEMRIILVPRPWGLMTVTVPGGRTPADLDRGCVSLSRSSGDSCPHTDSCAEQTAAFSSLRSQGSWPFTPQSAPLRFS